MARIPDVRTELGLREAALGLVLAALSAGVIAGLVLAGRLVPRTGSQRVVLVGGTVAALALPLVGAAPSAWLLALGLVVLGAGASSMDVGMNAQGVGVEARYGRSIMVGLHAAWSVGALTGAVGASVAMASSVPLVVHLGVVGALVLTATLVCTPWLRVADRTATTPADRGAASDPDRPAAVARRPFAWPRGPLFPLAMVALAATLGESTAGDWSGVHLSDNLDVPPGRVAWGYVASTAAMVLVRLVGDLLTDRFGRRRVVRVGGWAAGVGFALVAVAPVLPLTLLGFALVGGGLGVTVPLAFAAAGRIGDSPGESVAAVATVGYLAFLVSPPVIGVVADLTSLPVAFAGVAVLVVALTRRMPAA